MNSHTCVAGAQAPRWGLGARLLAMAAIGLAAPSAVLAQGTASDAEFLAAVKLQKGDGAKADPSAAAAEFKRLADAGHVAAACQFAQAAYGGIGVARNTRLADQYAEKGAADGSGACLAILGDAYQVGRTGYKKSDATAFAWYIKAATAGSAHGMYEVGEAYRVGTGVEQDTPQAVQWLEKAVARDNVEAMTSLGSIFINSKTFVRRSEGLKLLRMAAERNDLQAQTWLGEALAFGADGIEPIPSEGHKWLKTAAERSSNRATLYLARMYRDGVGVPADWALASQWADKALQRNHIPAATFLGRLYAKGGPNLRQNLRLGFEHLKRAYGSGDREALADLQAITDYRSGSELLKLADTVFYSMAHTDYFGNRLGSELQFDYSDADRLYYVGKAKLIVHLELTESGNVAMTLQASTVDILKPFYVNYVLNRIHKLSDHENWLTIRTQVLN